MGPGLGLVLCQLSGPALVGIVAGVSLAAALATVLTTTDAASQTGSVRVLDPMAYAASICIITVTCAIAASIPASRAGRVDPIVALRRE